MGFPGGSDLKESARNIRNPGLIPGSGRSPGEGKGNPLQYSCLGNVMDRGAWCATLWEMSWTEDPGVLHSTGSQRVGNDLVTKQQQAYNKPPIYS